MKDIKLRCSGLPQFMTCAPSELNPEGLVQVYTEVPAAELGTLVHEFAQRIVDTGEYNVEELIARKPEDMERAELLIRNFFTVYSEARTVLTKPQTEVYAEAVLFEHIGNPPNAHRITITGHIDLCQIEPTVAHILDYKTGRVHDNHYHQIAGYARLAWEVAGKPDVYTVNVSVVYLEDLDITNYVFTADDLVKWSGEVVAKVSDTRYTVGKKCAYCAIQGSCPAYREYTQAAIRFLQSDNAQKGKVGWTDVEPEERGSLVDAMYVVDKGLGRVKDTMKNVLQGSPKDAALDLGHGVGYTKVVRTTEHLNTKRALPLLRQRYDQEHLDKVTEISLTDLLDLAASFAPKGQKQAEKDKLLRKLRSAGVIYTTKQERFERRPLKGKTDEQA